MFAKRKLWPQLGVVAHLDGAVEGVPFPQPVAAQKVRHRPVLEITLDALMLLKAVLEDVCGGRSGARRPPALLLPQFGYAPHPVLPPSRPQLAFQEF